MRDFVGARYAIAAVRINDDETATHYSNRVKKAGILCRSEDFWGFMEDVYGPEYIATSEEEAANSLCRILRIQSRTELNGNANAQAAFDQLVAEFERNNNGDF
jgi:hypothetical protein